MAEYIDIDKIEYRQGVLLDDSMPIIRKVVTIDDIRDWTPKDNVVERSKMHEEIERAYRLGQEKERSKVNKAVKEIIKLSPTPTEEDVIYGNQEKTLIKSFLIAVLNIIEKNLGSD